jgi:hypothetical protein
MPFDRLVELARKKHVGIEKMLMSARAASRATQGNVRPSVKLRDGRNASPAVWPRIELRETGIFVAGSAFVR